MIDYWTYHSHSLLSHIIVVLRIQKQRKRIQHTQLFSHCLHSPVPFIYWDKFHKFGQWERNKCGNVYYNSYKNIFKIDEIYE